MPTAMNQLIKTRLFILLPFICVTNTVYAGFHPIDEIRETAINYVQQHVAGNNSDVRISSKPLDKRLRLPLCESPLESFFPHANNNGRNTTVGIRCHGPKPWSIYVGVTVNIFKDVVVSVRTMARNSIITDNDIQLKRMSINHLSGAYIEDAKKIIGLQLTRPLQINTPVLTSMLKKPIEIRRGDKVRLVARSTSFAVSMEGEALTDAAIGDKIRVRNSRSRRVIEGKLVNHDTVFVR